MPSVQSIGNSAISITELIGQVASFGEKALPVAELVAGLFPGGGTVVAAIQLALPIINRITNAVPFVTAAINAGIPIAQAVDEHGPDLFEAVKQLYAIALNHDPMRPEDGMTASTVNDDDSMLFAKSLFGRRWTQEETERWWDRASAGSFS